MAITNTLCIATVNTNGIATVPAPLSNTNPMRNLHKRLKWARLNAGFESAAAAVRALEAGGVLVEIGTYRHHENGTRRPTTELAARYAKFFGVREMWLVLGQPPVKEGEGLSDVRGQIVHAPIISWVSASLMATAIPDFSEFPESVPVVHSSPTLAALRVHGTSINRVAPDGAIIVFDYEDKHLEDKQLYVFGYGDEATVKRYRCTDGPVRLEPDSTEPHATIYPESDFTVIGRVRWVVAAV